MFGATNKPMTKDSRHIAIVGGGVIGLSIAWQLARAGQQVSIYERGQCGREASWAAAGMLAAAAETAPGQESFFALARASRDLWHRFAAELEAASGVKIGYAGGATLVAAQSVEHATHLRLTAKHLRGFDEPVRLLSGAEAIAREPTLAKDVQLALLSPKDGQVENRALCEALVIACSRAGVSIYEHQAVQQLEQTGNVATGVRVNDEVLDFDGVVFCAGAWTSANLFGAERLAAAVRPVKGQMLALQTDAAAPTHIVWGQGVYIVPREDGRIVIGATAEEAGFDTEVHRTDIASLHARASQLVPSLADAEVVESWAGLRPGSRDDLPLMGPLEIDHLWVASGHYRNGILLAPITAKLMARAILDGQAPAPLLPFLPTRFA